MPLLLNAQDYRAAARRLLPKALFEYIDRGAEDENALRRLRDVLDAVHLVPTVLTGHGERNLQAEVLGHKMSMPVIIAPTALAGMVSHNGEIKIARAAERIGIPACISTQSVTTVEEIRAGAPAANLWFQLYLWKDRSLSRALLERVQKAGVDTLVVTADTPTGPKREYNQRNGFAIPIKYSARLGFDVATHPRWLAGVLMRYILTTGMPTYGHYPEEFRSSVTRAQLAERVKLENLLNWNDIHELRRWWKGKLIIKGVLSVEDAELAHAAGAEGIVVSSHGARNLDILPAPIEVLPQIADRLGDKLEIIADSGIQRGSDVVKYVASGAKAVMIGRLPLWGLAVGGETGADNLLSMLRNEIDLTLTMLGRKTPYECQTSATRS
jgi:L-lactate dehydrogenase (cytochrome)